MIAVRPTFSESWYRVAALKPRLRAGAQLSRQFFRGERWYVVRDPAGTQFHRLSDAAYRFVGLLDGRRSVSEAWDIVGGQLADDAPTQPEVIQLLSQLYAANLLETDISPDAMVLLKRHKKMAQQRMQGRLMNVLFPRIPLWDPDRFLCRWMPVAKVVFSKLGALLWLIVVVSALAMVLPRWAELRESASRMLDIQHNVSNVFLLYLTFVFTKAIHELGHAFACRRFGGECHELGIMLLVAVPTPYVDASTAWSFPSKWQRMFVGMAGMIVELFFASICAFIWRYTNPATEPVLRALCYNAMFIAGFSTVVFNANPLLRYDGYYILSDLLEIPNLRQKSTEYALGLIQRHLFGVKMSQPLPPIGQRIWLFLYAVSSGIYRVFVGIVIIMVVFDRIPVLGVLMSIGGVVTWVAAPLYKVGKYLLLDPALHRKRWRAVGITTAALGAAVYFIGYVPMPMRVEFSGVLKPDDPVDSRGGIASGDLRTAEDGRVTNILAGDGQRVKQGQVLMRLENPDLVTQLASEDSQVQEFEAKVRWAMAKDPNELPAFQKDVELHQKAAARIAARIDALSVRAPFDGELVSPHLNEFQDAFIARGTEVGRVAVLSDLVVVGDLEQKDAQLASDAQLKRTGVEIRLAGLADQTIYVPASEMRVAPAATDQIADQVLSQAGGGDILVDAHDPNGLKTTAPVFEVRIPIANNGEEYHPGQRATVRIEFGRRSLAWQWTRKLYQMFEQNNTGKWT